MKSPIQHALRVNAGYIRELVEPIDEATWAHMPKTDGGIALNPPAWIVPHVTVAMSFIVNLLGGGFTTPEDWFSRYGMKSNPTDQSADYPTKDEALRTLDATVAALIAAHDRATPEQLAVPTPVEDFRKLVPTVGDAVAFVALTHTATHTGQLLSWLRCTGTGPRF